MANRTVSVGLEMQAGQYKAEADLVKEKTESIDRAVEGLDRDINKLTPDAVKASAAMAALAAEEAKAKTSVTGLGDETRKTTERTTGLGDEAGRTSSKIGDISAAITKVDEEIARSKTVLSEWAQEINRTGDADLFKKFRTEKSNLGILESVKKELEATKQEVDRQALDIGQSFWSKLFHLGGSSVPNELITQIGQDGLRAGGMFGSEFGQGFMGVLSTLGPVLAPVLVPLVAGIVTAVGAGLTGAVLGGVGLGAIGAGIAAQLQDNEVKTAATELGHWLKGELTWATSGFTEPLLAGLTYLQRDVGPFFSEMKDAFTSLSPYVSMLIDGFGNFVAKLGPGLNQALQASGPVLERIAMDLPMIGSAVSDFFDQISKGSKGGTEAIHEMLMGIADFVRYTGFVLRGLADGFDWLVRRLDQFVSLAASVPVLGKVWEPAKKQLDDIKNSFDGAHASSSTFSADLTGLSGSASSVAGPLGAASRQAQGLASSFQSATLAAGGLASQLDKNGGKTIAATEAHIAMTYAVDAMSQSLKTNGNHWDVNTKAGAANTTQFIAGAKAAAAVAQAVYEQTGSIKQANEAWNAAIKKLDDGARAAGATARQVADLNWQYANVPPYKETILKTKFVTEGTPPGAYTPGLHIAQRWGGIHYAAEGLVSFAQAAMYNQPTYGIAEPQTGGEAFVPRFGDYGRSTGILDQASRWYGGRFMAGGQGGASAGGTVRVVFDLGRGDSELARLIRSVVTVEGGGNVQLAFGSSR